MFKRFRSKFGKQLAKAINLAALFSLFASMFTFGPAMPVQAAEALASLKTTLAQPIYSNNFVTDPTFTNVSYTWSQTKAYNVAGGDACIVAQDCMDILIDLQDTAPTTSFLGQEWQNTIVPGDIVWSGPANSSVSTTQRLDVNSNGRFEELMIRVQCSAACLFATSTAYTLSIVNYPLKNPQTPGGYTAGSYTSLTQAMTIADNSVSNQQDEAETSVVAIGKGITVSASVDPTLTFSVTGVASSTAFYGDSSTTDTSGNPDACSFGTLTPGAPKVCLFNLNISTNAAFGYAIYVVQDQNMTFNGNSIKQFKDGTRIDESAATFWTSPSSTQLAHLGYSSNDTSVFTATGTALWAGVPNIATSAQAPVTTGLVADSATPNTASYVYALKVESAASLPQATAYTHHEYFMVVGNF